MSPPTYDFCGQEGSKISMSNSNCLSEVFQYAFQGARDTPVVLR